MLRISVRIVYPHGNIHGIILINCFGLYNCQYWIPNEWQFVDMNDNCTNAL